MKKGICFFIIVFLLLPNFIVFSGNTSFDIQLIFQNPSYVLQKDEILSQYICDPAQTECRVNYNLEVNEWSWFKPIGTKYICEWNFWMTELTGEEQKCNPSTIIYWTWIFQTSFKVFLKTDESISYNREFLIQNGEIVDELPPQDIPLDIDEEEIDEIYEEQDEADNIPNEEIPSQEESTWNTQENPIVIEEQIQEESEDIPEIPDWWQEWTFEVISHTWTISWTWVETHFSSGQINNEIFLFPTKVLFQSPTYLLEKENENTQKFTCDTTQTECRVNYNLEINEWSWFKSIGTKYICEWDFWIWHITWEEQKCNPNTILYPVWDFVTTYKIQEKSKPLSFKIETLQIKNTWYIEPVITKTVYVGWWWSSGTLPIFIENPKIEIQSWLDQTYLCKKQDCSINLNYITKNSSEKCLWSFPWWNYDWDTNEKCNPGYVSYPFWDFRVTLKVYDKNYPENYKESYLNFSHIPPEISKISDQVEKNWNQNKESSDEWIIQKIEKIPDYTLKITQILPNPIGTDNLEFIEIQNTWEQAIDIVWCSLDDSISSGSKPYKISQSLLLEPKQAKKFYKYDTKLNINNSWKEEVNIICNEKIIDSIWWEFSPPEGFILTPEQNLSEIVSVKKQKNTSNYEIVYLSWEKKNIVFNTQSTLLLDLMTEDISREEKKEKFFTLLEKSFSQKISKQKTWVRIYGTTFPNTHIMIQLEKQENEVGFLHYFFFKSYADNLIYETKSDKNGNYQVTINTPDIWEFELKTFLNFWEHNTYEVPKTSILEIDKDYIEYIQPKQNLKQVSEYIQPKAIITLQWKISQNKTFFNNKLTCHDVNQCSVNLDGTQSEGKNLEYFWDFGNGKTFDKKNPASYNFWEGIYFISLTVHDKEESDTTHFIVEVLPKPQKENLSTTKVENKIEKNNKINIIPTAYAESKKQENIKYHIWFSIFVFVTFFIGGIILLRRQKII